MPWRAKLEAGKAANLSVLSGDPFTIGSESLGSMKPEAVIFEGNVVAGSL